MRKKGTSEQTLHEPGRKEYAAYLLSWSANPDGNMPLLWEDWVRGQLKANKEASPARTRPGV